MNSSRNRFSNREEAGRELAKKLSHHKSDQTVVLAIPRGGVAVGYFVAEGLEAPLDLIFSKKIGHPINKEFAIGAVSLDAVEVHNRINVSKEYLDEEIKRIREGLKEFKRKFQGDRSSVNVDGKVVIIVDDGIATGSTMQTTVQMVRKQGAKKVVVAIPVAPRSALERLEKSSDEVICLLTPPDFQAIGKYFEDFHQVSEEDVTTYLRGKVPARGDS